MIDEPIKLPVRYEADDTSIRDRDFTLLVRVGEGSHFSVAECDRIGYHIAKCINEYPQVAALTAALKHVKELGEKFTMPTLVDIAQNALAAGGKDGE